MTDPAAAWMAVFLIALDDDELAELNTVVVAWRMLDRALCCWGTDEAATRREAAAELWASFDKEREAIVEEVDAAF